MSEFPDPLTEQHDKSFRELPKPFQDPVVRCSMVKMGSFLNHHKDEIRMS